MTDLRDTSNQDWTYVENGVVVYRASALGGCIRSLVASRLGETPTRPGEALQAAMDASSSVEATTIAAYVRETGHEVVWQQKEVELEVVAYESDQPLVIVRGHIDGLDKVTDDILEVKSLGLDLFAKWNSGGVDALGMLGLKYKWQAALYGHATNRNVAFVIGEKLRDSENAEFSIGNIIREPAVSPESLVPSEEIDQRIATIEEHVANDTYPDCDRGCTNWDAYGHIHIFEGPTIHSDGDLEELLELYDAARVAEEDAKDKKNEIRAKVIEAYGVGKHATGKFNARVEKVNGQRFDTTAFKKHHRDLYESFLVPQTSVRLTVKRVGE